MDPQVKSALTSLGIGIVGIFTGWAATSGLIKPEDVPALTSALMTIAGIAAASVITIYKARQHTPEAEIKAVNTGDNGVKVVAATEPVQTVTEPLKK